MPLALAEREIESNFRPNLRRPLLLTSALVLLKTDVELFTYSLELI